MKILIASVVFLILFLILGWLLYRHAGDCTNREVHQRVLAESSVIQGKVDARCDALEKKLDRIEAKLDRLLKMAEPKFPDGMRPAD